MHFVELLLGRLFFSGKLDLRVEIDACDCQLATFIFLQVTDCVIDIFVEKKLFLTSDREKGEHVATGERSDKCLLGIDILRVPEIGRSCGRRYFMATVEFPSVIAVVGLILEVGRGAVPGERHFVFGHSLV